MILEDYLEMYPHVLESPASRKFVEQVFIPALGEEFLECLKPGIFFHINESSEYIDFILDVNFKRYAVKIDSLDSYEQDEMTSGAFNLLSNLRNELAKDGYSLLTYTSHKIIQNPKKCSKELIDTIKLNYEEAANYTKEHFRNNVLFPLYGKNSGKYLKPCIEYIDHIELEQTIGYTIEINDKKYIIQIDGLTLLIKPHMSRTLVGEIQDRKTTLISNGYEIITFTCDQIHNNAKECRCLLERNLKDVAWVISGRGSRLMRRMYIYFWIGVILLTIIALILLCILPPPSSPSRPKIILLSKHSLSLETKSELYAATLSPELMLLANGYRDGTIKIINYKDFSTLPPIYSNHGKIFSLAISPINRRIAVGYFDGTISIFDMSNSKSVSSWPAYTYAVHGLVFCSDRKELISISYNGNIVVWSEDGTFLRTHQIAEKLTSIALSPDDKILSLGLASGKVLILSAFDFHHIQSFSVSTVPIRSMAFSTNGEILVVGDEKGEIGTYNISSQEILDRKNSNASYVLAIASNSLGQIVSISKKDNTFSVWKQE